MLSTDVSINRSAYRHLCSVSTSMRYFDASVMSVSAHLPASTSMSMTALTARPAVLITPSRWLLILSIAVIVDWKVTPWPIVRRDVANVPMLSAAESMAVLVSVSSDCVRSSSVFIVTRRVRALMTRVLRV